jgi:hypothetical protein
MNARKETIKKRRDVALEEKREKETEIGREVGE